MCHNCIISDIRAGTLRRGVLGMIAASAVGLAAMPSLPAAAQVPTAGRRRVVDLTHTLTPDFPTYFGTPAFALEPQFRFTSDGLNLNRITYPEHVGTHFDAPLHFSADGRSVDELPIESLVCPLAVVDVRAKAAVDADYRLTPDDIRSYEAVHGPIPESACVVMNSGWDAHVGTSRFRGEDAGKVLHFPGFHLEAADFLIRERSVNGIGVDTLSLDHGPSKDSAVHYRVLPSNRYGIEGLANLSSLPPTGATLVAGAPKIKGGTGGPGRVIALL